ncbi:heme-dependent oxidative N-demethylase family protein [Falsibacillus albus]|uniref:DUF3445 domain-containing protein n=1 Tax=Falsibacillus albus TaxID=2478915 RepID=A0A3L7JU69_9BACI|nr:DUF3445 domain-containing protein [Falsibacillus albus]RLQ93824.1 DUF3445 domain-containing protein [Falsibacillus albus]
MIDELKQFPYPFKDDVYRYSNNSTLMERPICVEVTRKYKEEVLLKRELLQEHPERCFQALNHTNEVQWEAVQLVMEDLATQYPEYFSLEKNGSRWEFMNKILDEKTEFDFGGSATLSYAPLDFIGRHVQEDLIIMMERDGDLFLDAGQLCFPSNWSLAFKLGMNFKDIHFPIPRFNEEGLDERILRFLLRIEAGNPWWRKNWSLMAGARLDTSLETFDVWGKERRKVTSENAGEIVHLRVEVQKLFRMPKSNAILFTIHTHLLPLQSFIKNRDWLKQFYAVLSELPAHIADYKGISAYRNAILEFLKKHLDEDGWPENE